MAASKPTAINFKKELFWVTCNRCARQMNDIRYEDLKVENTISN